MKTNRIKYKLQLFKNISLQNYAVNKRDLFKQISFTNEKMQIINSKLYTASFIDTSMYAFSKIPYDTFLYEASTEIDPYILWNYINHNSYKTNIDEINYNDSLYLDTDIKRNLYENCTLLNIPQDLYKTRIKPGSVVINDYSSKTLLTIKDDSNCNLLVQNTASFVPENNLILDISFNEKYKDRIKNKTSLVNVCDFSIYKNHGIPLNNINYVDGFVTSGSTIEAVGTQASFDGSSSIMVKHIPTYKFKDNDYAISFWISASVLNTQEQYQYIFAKEQLTNLEVKEKTSGIITYKYKKILTGNYPFSVRLISSGSGIGHLYFSRLGGDKEVFVTSSMAITGSQYHVVCQKSGSNLQLYINGIADSAFSSEVNGRTDNDSPIYIGSLNNEEMFYTGKLDEIKFYNKALSQDEILSLADNSYNTCHALQTNQIGNVFYKSGDIVISTINPRYKKILKGYDGNRTYVSQSTNTGFSVDFRREHTLYEHEIVCKIPSSQFNFSTNPTLKLNNDSDVETFKSFVTGSDFRLYFTTIGLYNDNMELLAIAKLSNPLPKYEDKDMNIIVKFDVD